MAGDWLKIEKETPNKPEILKMARMLKIDRDAVFGKWVRIWAWFDSNSVDGSVDGVVDADVDALVACEGFTSAARSVGWLESSPELEKITLPNFDAHNGQTAKTRAQKTQRQRKWRENASPVIKKPVDASVGANESTTTSTIEEKRREEKKEDSIGGNATTTPAKAKEPKKKFVPPTVDEVGQYCQQKAIDIDPLSFVAYYESQDWKKNNGLKVSNWKACIVTWMKRDKGSKPKPAIPLNQKPPERGRIPRIDNHEGNGKP